MDKLILPLPIRTDTDMTYGHDPRLKWLEAYDKAEAEITKKLCKQIILTNLKNGLHGNHLQQIYDVIPKPPEKTEWKMITVSAKDKVDPVEFWKRTDKFVQNNEWVKQAIYSIEQRSEGEQEPYGWHVHILGIFSYPKSQIIQKTFRSFKSFVVAPNYIDVRPSTESREDYIKGDKCPDKMSKVKRDRVLREELKIPQYAEKISNNIV